MNTLTKTRPSKLAPFQEALLDMDAENKTLAEIQQWLAGRGVVVSTMAISKFLTSRRRQRWEAQLLDKFAGGGQSMTASKIPNGPNLDTLIQLSRFLVFEHATKVMNSVESARKSTQITKLVLNYINRQARIGCKTSEVTLAATRLAIREASARDHALTKRLPKTKDQPEPSEIFQAALATLLAGPQNQQTCPEFKLPPTKPC
jgi:hypothetical protein